MHSQYHNLAEALGVMQSKGISLATVEADLGANAPGPHSCCQAKKLAHEVQKAARRALTLTLPSAPEVRLRSKLERWALPLYPRLRAARAAAVTARLSKLASPRVLAAVLRTWFNGWCTKLRFQCKGSCVFGSPSGRTRLTTTCGARNCTSMLGSDSGSPCIRSLRTGARALFCWTRPPSSWMLNWSYGRSY